MYFDTHVVASLALIGSMFVISGVGIKLLRDAMRRDAGRSSR
ncbi:hypothetical protein [Halomonas sp. NCCP-2165]|nr:hypothetical protein [Halomonas sp. NCCP-2165]GKW50722.1 hypothetical protein NCCP2165_29370 [Halomonas sp. NCCP-2165]